MNTAKIVVLSNFLKFVLFNFSMKGILFYYGLFNSPGGQDACISLLACHFQDSSFKKGYNSHYHSHLLLSLLLFLLIFPTFLYHPRHHHHHNTI